MQIVDGKKIFTIVTINPGSTSTKIGVYRNDQKVFIENIYHTKEELEQFDCVQSQLMYRAKLVENACRVNQVNLDDVDSFVARGGGMASCVSGVYSVNDQLIYDCQTARTGVSHPAMLACQIARYLESRYGGRALVFNPPDVDEFQDLARISGIKGMYRDSHVHCLNQKEAAHRYCLEKGIRYEDHNFVVAHIGGGVSFTAHRKGKMIDSNDNLAGDGPMTPTRVGSFPTVKIIKMAYSGKYTYKQMEELLTRKGGLYSHLGTDDMREIVCRIRHGDEYAKLCTDAMAYAFNLCDRSNPSVRGMDCAGVGSPGIIRVGGAGERRMAGAYRGSGSAGVYRRSGVQGISRSPLRPIKKKISTIAIKHSPEEACSFYGWMLFFLGITLIILYKIIQELN